ncbi:MAG: CHAT domain-containing protein [Cyanobacteria bacterium P01_H01_bin.105]
MRSQFLSRILSRFFTHPPFRRRLWLTGIAILTALLCIVVPPLVTGATASVSLHQAQAADSLEQQGRTAYETGDYANAAQLFQQAAAQYELTGQPVRAALALANLSLSQQQVSRWAAAETAVDDALSLVPVSADAPAALWAARGEILAIQGQSAFSQGNSSDAIAVWAAAATAYDQAGQLRNAARYQISQARALQTAGFSDLALSLVEGVLLVEIAPQDDVTVDALRTYGDLLGLNGQGELAETKLQEALELAETLELPTAAIYRSLGRLADANDNKEAALTYYQRANEADPSDLATQVNQLNLLVTRSDWGAIASLLPTLTEQLQSQPANREIIYTRLTFAQTLIDLRQTVNRTLNGGVTLSAKNAASEEPIDLIASEDSFSNPEADLRLLVETIPPGDTIATLLLETYTSAVELNDVKAQAYALFTLGQLYMQTEQWEIARQQTLDALGLVQGGRFPEVEYQLQDQLCKILQNIGTEGQTNNEAIKACRAAVYNTDQLRNDIAAKGADAAFDFQKSVEPVYRNFVDLLLKADQSDEAAYKANLKEARAVLDSLQLAELDNFFREACLEIQSIELEEVIDDKTAVIYPIILENRLEIILSLSDKISRYTAPVSKAQLNATIRRWNNVASRSSFTGGDSTDRSRNSAGITVEPVIDGFGAESILNSVSQELYEWLITPLEPDLIQANVDTLVFIPDGSLRNISMSALYDGEQYLIEKYAVALTPGLQLIDPTPINRQELRAFVAGVSKFQNEFPNFPALAGVERELQTIEQIVDSDIFLNEAATTKTLETRIATSSAPIVHIATHGQFSSNADETFIVAWQDKLTVNQLSQLLKTSELSRDGELELLILSACQTAEGDDRAALGIAGVATRSGARSTIATLWDVADDSTAELISEFYRQLASSELTKAKALQQAQLSILNNPDYKTPYFWSPFILLGNWL